MKYFLVFLLTLIFLFSLSSLVLNENVKINNNLDQTYLRLKSSKGILISDEYPYILRNLQENIEFDLEKTFFQENVHKD